MFIALGTIVKSRAGELTVFLLPNLPLRPANFTCISLFQKKIFWPNNDSTLKLERQLHLTLSTSFIPLQQSFRNTMILPQFLLLFRYVVRFNDSS